MSNLDRFISFDIAHLAGKIVNEGEESFKTDVQQLLEAVQSARAAKLHETRELQLSAYHSMREEIARLAGRMPDDRRVETLGQAARAVVARAGDLDREIDIAGTRVPMVKKTEALVHGRVTDAIDRGAAGVSVFLADESGTEVRGVKPVQTDEAGYFALVVPAAAAAEIGSTTKLRVILQRGGNRVVPGTSSPISVEPGAARLNDVKLGDEEGSKLGLRAIERPGPVSKRGSVKGRAVKTRRKVRRG